MAHHTRGIATPYPRPIRWLHWLMALLVATAAGVALVRDDIGGRALRGVLLDIHRHLGLLVLALLALRIVLRLSLRHAPGVPMPAWLRVGAGFTHLLLYALLLAMPLLGWALASAADQPIHLFGVAVPPIVAPDDDLADRLQAWHVRVAWVLLAVAGLHAGAALWHHLVRRDGVLRRMWP
ncbi:cytochrome b/b6 domain-containing protein [Luteibacter sp. PPL201]|uniref:Cytochrome b/b6 domain-containing protein n=1 Tax=Luteibacter sahnii TaxID=3021977 RepID=A0ABT6B650_9GAMM